jgi:adenylate kinase
VARVLTIAGVRTLAMHTNDPLPRTNAMASALNLLLIGPPGAGKGTQASRLGDDLGVPLVSTGEILRANVRNGTTLGRAAQTYLDSGDLVPDDLIVAIVMARVDLPDTDPGFILDGFPRTPTQANALLRHLEEQGRSVTAALLLDVPDAEIVKRIAGRRVCVAAGHSYHVDHNPPKRPSLCDEDGSGLIQRDDDRPEVVKRRLEVYREQTAPLVRYYLERSLLTKIDGSVSPSEVHDRICEALASLERPNADAMI